MDERQYESKVQAILKRKFDSVHRSTDRIFLGLLLAQWVFAVVLSVVVTPYTWEGARQIIHIHVLSAFLLGGLINALPIGLILLQPGAAVTRHVVCAAQMLWSALFIHLTGGRIETHFHVFGSLAFISFYRDRSVLATATVVTALDHFFRGVYWPESVYGIQNPEWWRFLEHAGWVVFEDVVLVLGCNRTLREMRQSAADEATLESVNLRIEEEVRAKTAALEESLQKAQNLQTELFQSQKVEAIGRLASGLAHEINTPVQSVSNNLLFLKDASNDLLRIGAEMQELCKTPETELPRKVRTRITDTLESANYDHLKGKMIGSIDQSIDGLSNVAQILLSMKEFLHSAQVEMAEVDLNHAIRTMLTVSSNEYKYVAEIGLDLEADLPNVVCHGGEINQVLFNLIVNAAQAIGEVVKGTDQRGLIRISTRELDDWVEIKVLDTGVGIPKEIHDRIFDPFFTTKEATGQGLAIARNIVCQKHGGSLTFNSRKGAGTQFVIRLPLCPKGELQKAA